MNWPSGLKPARICDEPFSWPRYLTSHDFCTSEKRRRRESLVVTRTCSSPDGVCGALTIDVTLRPLFLPRLDLARNCE